MNRVPNQLHSKTKEHKWEMQEGYVLRCLDCGKVVIVSKAPKREKNIFVKSTT